MTTLELQNPGLLEIPGRKQSKARLLAVAGLAASALFCVDQTAENLTRRERTRVISYADGISGAPENVATLICPGFNVREPDNIATALYPILRRVGRVAVVHYSDRGLNLGEIFDRSNEYCAAKGVTTLDIYGHSFGGDVAVELAARRARAGLQTRLVNLDCSPESHQDVRGNQNTGLRFLELTHRLGLTGGKGVRAAIDLSLDITTNSTRPHRALVNAIRNAAEGQPANRLLQSEGRYMRRFRSTDFVGDLCNVIITHTSPLRPETDSVIDNDQGISAWQSSLSGRMHCFYAETGHADPSQHTLEYLDMMNQIYSQAGILQAA